jgi:hypothetical protein
MEYNPQREWSSADGIPITPNDDTFKINIFLLMRIIALNTAGGKIIGNSDVVVPVATETNFQNCHKTGDIVR